MNQSKTPFFSGRLFLEIWAWLGPLYCAMQVNAFWMPIFFSSCTVLSFKLKKTHTLTSIFLFFVSYRTVLYVCSKVCCIYFRNTSVQSKTSLAVAAFVCDADSRENVRINSITCHYFKTTVLYKILN